MTDVPLVSIVIPTYARPAMLARAVQSCWSGMPSGTVEVIVVANGGDASAANGALSSFPGVRILELPEANGNAARNAGLAAAKGRFVRFLDDDDYLIAPGAAEQYRVASKVAADICSGTICLAQPDGREIAYIPPHQSGDFACEVLSPRATTQPTAHLFRREFLSGLRWDPARPHLQDVDWMHGILRHSEARWVGVPDVVGVWEHHRGTRVSTGSLKRFPDMALRELASITRATIAELQQSNRLDGIRRVVAAEALWHYAHHGFALAPRYWAGVAREALALDPCSRPDVEFYRHLPWRLMPPLLLETLIAPKRWLSHRIAGR